MTQYDRQTVQAEIPKLLVEFADCVAEMEYATRTEVIRGAVLSNIRHEEQTNEMVQTALLSAYNEGSITTETLARILAPDQLRDVEGAFFMLEERPDTQQSLDDFVADADLPDSASSDDG